MSAHAFRICTAIAALSFWYVFHYHWRCPRGEDIRERIVRNHFEFVPPGEGPFPTLIAIPGCSGIAFGDPAMEGFSHTDRAARSRLAEDEFWKE